MKEPHKRKSNAGGFKKVKGGSKRYHLLSKFTPGEVWRVHASKNGGPVTEGFVMIGEAPDDWESMIKCNYAKCTYVNPHLIRSHLKYGVQERLTMAQIDYIFTFLRHGELRKSDWTVFFEMDYVLGYLEYIEPVGFEPWIPAYSREDMIPPPPVKNPSEVK